MVTVDKNDRLIVSLDKADLEKISILFDNFLFHYDIDLSTESRFAMIELKAKIDVILDEK